MHYFKTILYFFILKIEIYLNLYYIKQNSKKGGKTMLAYNIDNNLDKDRINEVALKMFFSITDKWQLNNQQKMKLLGLENAATFFNYKKYNKGKLNKDKLERISYIVGIYKALQILLPNTANDWINKENTLFNGLKPLDIMLSGNVSDLYIIRKYLDAERGALYG